MFNMIELRSMEHRSALAGLFNCTRKIGDVRHRFGFVDISYTHTDGKNEKNFSYHFVSNCFGNN